MEDDSCFFSRREHEKSSWYRFSKEYRKHWNAGWHWSGRKGISERSGNARGRVVQSPSCARKIRPIRLELLWRLLAFFYAFWTNFLRFKIVIISGDVINNIPNIVRQIYPPRGLEYLLSNLGWKIVRLHIDCFSLYSALALGLTKHFELGFWFFVRNAANQHFIEP